MVNYDMPAKDIRRKARNQKLTDKNTKYGKEKRIKAVNKTRRVKTINVRNLQELYNEE